VLPVRRSVIQRQKLSEMEKKHKAFCRIPPYHAAKGIEPNSIVLMKFVQSMLLT
jgi:hypothetical protein